MRQQKFLESYRNRNGSGGLKDILAVMHVDQSRFDLWLQDEEFFAELQRIDQQRMFYVREKLITAMPAVIDNMTKLASTGTKASAVSAARLLLEASQHLGGVQGRRPTTVNVQQNIINDRRVDEEELIRELKHLRSIERSFAREDFVEAEVLGDGTSSPEDSSGSAD